jgi:replicative superfamily II helicase
MVNGIDNQIMITRTAEYARTVADQVNEAQKASQFAAQMEKERAIHGTHTVSETEHMEHKLVRKEKERGSGRDQEQEDAPKEAKARLTEEEEEAQKVMPSETLGKEIDISV